MEFCATWKTSWQFQRFWVAKTLSWLQYTCCALESHNTKDETLETLPRDKPPKHKNFKTTFTLNQVPTTNDYKELIFCNKCLTSHLAWNSFCPDSVDVVGVVFLKASKTKTSAIGLNHAQMVVIQFNALWNYTSQKFVKPLLFNKRGMQALRKLAFGKVFFLKYKYQVCATNWFS